MSAPLLAVEGVSRSFGSVEALRDVSFALEAGRVVCLLGDNGAGKSTLIRILSGVHAPSSGRVLIDGVEAALASPRAALARGIATVHQDLALVPLMSVWRNFFLGSEPTRGRGPFRRLDVDRCRAVARDELARLGITGRDVDQPVGTLSGGERQAVAIARAIHLGARVLIMDEPTAALGVRQSALVLGFIEAARVRGVGVVLVTHNPQHAIAVGDRFVVLRRGSVVAAPARGQVDAAGLARLMEGVDEPAPSPRIGG